MVDINDFVQSMKNGPDKFVLTDEGEIKKLLGIEINHIDEKSLKLSQPLLNYMILYLLNIDTNGYGMDTNTN